MYRLRLQAVDSRNATPEELEEADITPEQIPTGMQIAAHQAATVKALRKGNAPIIINQAMTGDGKTLAGRFQLLSEKWRTFAMYPTNELAHDQVQSFDELIGVWPSPVWKKLPRKRLINAHEIDEFSFGDGVNSTRLEELKGMLRTDYVLTNPDIFHLIMNFAYQQQGIASDILPTFLAERFRLYIFDEFHLFGIEQTASVMIAMLLLKHLAGEIQPPRFLFLSATPQKMLTTLAGRVELAYEPPVHGIYEQGRPQPAENYRRILRETNLTVYSGRLEDWVKEHFEDTIKPFFLENRPAAKGLIIANGVATAHRVRDYLEPLCKAQKIVLGINTGLTPKEDRSRDFDLLVATSTVDVDFKINFMVFESRDAASHQQRLGRLGRHASDTHGNPFQTYEAHALLPQWTIDGLMQAFPDENVICREDYKRILEENFSPLQQFEDYIERWAGVQAAKVLHALSDKSIRTQYKELSNTLKNDFQALFGKSVKKYFALVNNKETATIATASSFRGGNVFTVLIQDPETSSKRIMSYSLTSLFRNADLLPVPIETLLRQAEKLGQDPKSLQKTNPLAAYRLLGWTDKPRDIHIELDTELPTEKLERVIEQNRFSIFCTGMSELQTLNEQLYECILVTFVIPDKDPDLVRRLLRLGFQTELFSFSAWGSLKGTVVFGRDALLIDSVLRRRKAQTAFFW